MELNTNIVEDMSTEEPICDPFRNIVHQQALDRMDKQITKLEKDNELLHELLRETITKVRIEISTPELATLWEKYTGVDCRKKSPLCATIDLKKKESHE